MGILDEGLRGMVQQIGAILFIENDKLDSRPINEDLRSI
jgi:hypothetical protein